MLGRNKHDTMAGMEVTPAKKFFATAQGQTLEPVCEHLVRCGRLVIVGRNKHGRF
jgi:hypothetical protein